VLSLDAFDGGLSDPEGIAQSQIRDLAVVLPADFSLNPAVGGFERCTEAEFEADGVGGEPEEGCPSGSKVGTIAVTSQLMEGPLSGEVFLGDMDGSSDPSLFVVVEDEAHGVLVKQLVVIEKDPETGELLAVAEDLPQVPFRHLELTLADGPGELLVTPGLCETYDGVEDRPDPIKLVLTPRSGGAGHLYASSFEIASGPGGGPCPDPPGEEPDASLVSHPSLLPSQIPVGPSVKPDLITPDTWILRRVLRRRPPIFQFRFRSTEPGSKFRCRLDGKRFRSCGERIRLKGLRPGRHVLRVVAIDSSGNRDPSAAIARFRVPKSASRAARHTHRRSDRSVF
jgi:hypothetical protein